MRSSYLPGVTFLFITFSRYDPSPVPRLAVRTRSSLFRARHWPQRWPPVTGHVCCRRGRSGRLRQLGQGRVLHFSWLRRLPRGPRGLPQHSPEDSGPGPGARSFQKIRLQRDSVDFLWDNPYPVLVHRSDEQTWVRGSSVSFWGVEGRERGGEREGERKGGKKASQSLQSLQRSLQIQGPKLPHVKTSILFLLVIWFPANWEFCFVSHFGFCPSSSNRYPHRLHSWHIIILLSSCLWLLSARIREDVSFLSGLDLCHIAWWGLTR